ncbi:MAG TPA: c-type cytochrome [Gaiellaceae bacterium]|nr:c-type cytochrome [Gaiellaceae bacterium]
MILLSVTTGNKLGLGLIGLATVVFAVVVAMVVPRRRPDFPRNLRGFLLVCVCLFAAMLFAIFYFAKETHEGNEALGESVTTTVEQAAPTTTAATTTATTTTAATTTSGTSTAGQPSSADLAAGRAVFTANCVSCHTLADAKATGTVGPNLDKLKPDEATVEHQVTNGGAIMPAFKGTLSSDQITAVATYVSSVAGTG